MKEHKFIGHRGAKAEVLENSREGFIHAHQLLDIGMDGIEFDVQITADNQLVLAHDNTLSRICGQQGRIEQLTASYCQHMFQQNTGHQLLTLPEVVPYLIGYKHIELELKTHERMNREKLLASLAKTFFDTVLCELPIVLTSFDVRMLELLQTHAQFRHVPRGLIVQDPFDNEKLVNTVLRLQGCSLGLKHTLVSSDIVTLCHRYDIKISVWTVNSLKIAKNLLELEVDTIITDHPTVFVQTLKR